MTSKDRAMPLNQTIEHTGKMLYPEEVPKKAPLCFALQRQIITQGVE